MSTSVSLKLRAYSSSSAVRQARTIPPMTRRLLQSMFARTWPVRRWKRSRKVLRSATAGAARRPGTRASTAPPSSVSSSGSMADRKESRSSHARINSRQPGNAAPQLRPSSSACQHSRQLMERSKAVGSTAPGSAAASFRNAPCSCSGTSPARCVPSGSCREASSSATSPGPRRALSTRWPQSSCSPGRPPGSTAAAEWWPRSRARSNAVYPHLSTTAGSQRPLKACMSSGESKKAAQCSGVRPSASRHSCRQGPVASERSATAAARAASPVSAARCAAVRPPASRAPMSPRPLSRSRSRSSAPSPCASFTASALHPRHASSSSRNASGTSGRLASMNSKARGSPSTTGLSPSRRSCQGLSRRHASREP
mmetsp:Transcript_83989/g.271800  ORF Transcript_83989/g.271800 Transcript_83989/m.271800 type:complete len:369 (-) Transcript_83989:266-1372(-)